MIARRGFFGLSASAALAPFSGLAASEYKPFGANTAADDIRGNSAGDQSAAVALSIGIGDYSRLPRLPGAIADAELMAAAFSSLGLKTYRLIDPDRQEFELALNRFSSSLHRASLAVIYVAGHGGFTGNGVHILPADRRYSNDGNFGFSEHDLLRAVSGAPRQKILIMDCCRTALIEAAAERDIPNGTAGQFTIYAAQPGGVAYDGKGPNGPLATALADALVAPGRSIEDVARVARAMVVAETGGYQIPWSRSSLLAPVILNR